MVAPRGLACALLLGALLVPAVSTEAAPTLARRIDAGGNGDYTDTSGNVWERDRAYTTGGYGYLGGATARVRSAIAGTTDDTLYQSIRKGTSLEYRFDVPNDAYTVTLKFAEVESGSFGVGRRVFGVSVEGQSVLSGFDIFAQVGANTALDRSFTVTLTDGSLNVVFTGVTGLAAVGAIEVVNGVAPAPDFSFAATPSAQTIAPNGSVVFTANVEFLNGFSSTNIDLWVTGLPSRVTGTYAPDPLTHEGMSQLTVTAGGRVATGTYTLTMGATGEGITHSQDVTLVVSSTPDFSVAVTPATQTVARGGSTSFQVSLTAVNGFASPVSLSVSGLPSGTSASFSPNPVTPTASSTMTVSATNVATLGQFGLTVSGTGGQLVRSGSTTLVVSTAGSVWSVSAIGSTGVANNSTLVGPGRSDGVNRVYVGTVNTGRVMELSWDGSAWGAPVDIGGSPAGLEIHNLGMGPGRNDGVTRIYACSLDGNLYELTYVGPGWTQATVGTPSGTCTHAAVGDGRNDGVDRLYATRGTIVWEYTRTGSSWSAVQVGSVPSGLVHGISLGPGRGGTVNHLYIASSTTGTYEATFSGGSWSMASMGDTGDVRNVSLGEGRNDGVMRVYAGTSQGDVREFTWTGTSWTNTTIAPSVGSVIVHAYVLDGRNDGVMRVYGAAGDGNAYEFTRTGSSWTTLNMGGGTAYLYGFHPGARPGETRNRLYGAAFDTNVYEFTWG